MELKNKIAIVLGASTVGGMGEAVARRLKREGATVVVSGLGAETLKSLAGQLEGTPFEADITDSEQMAALVAHTLETHGRLDIAINVAGVAPRVPFCDFTDAHLMFMAKMHFIGPAMFIKHAAEVIADDGAIVNVSSLSAYDAMPGIVGYAASKLAGDRVVRGAALEYRHKRLRINGIVPSLVPTGLSRQGMRNYGADPEPFEQSFVDQTPLGRLARPEDIAAMAFMLVRDEFFETGQIFTCTGGNALLGHPRHIG
ncbi:MAG: SDR family oxidoreductase [Pseudomonas sp.]|uniref:SDR family NAD(P)-dependent oxidoreductase n=1 Tax=Pseudomonas sp. TaxID=306 RepID=UPI0039828B88